LLLGFVVNLILRAIWLAMLGVNFSFPKGINYERLKYSSFYEDKLRKKGSLVERILSVEKIASLSFSIAIAMTLISIGVFVLLTICFWFISNYLPSWDGPIQGYILMVFFLLITVGMLDDIFFGWLRKFPLVSKIYYPFHFIFNFLGLSFIFKKEWLTIISNVKRWKIYSIILIYFFAAFVFMVKDLEDVSINFPKIKLLNLKKGDYQDLNFRRRNIRNNIYQNLLPEGERLASVSLESDVIKNRYAKLFVLYRRWFDPMLDSMFLKHQLDLEVIKTFQYDGRADVLENDSTMNAMLNDFFQVHIDQEKQENIEWFFHYYPVTNEFGFLTYLDTDTLSAGKHMLHVYMEYQQNEGDTLTNIRYRELPFFKE